MPGTSRLYPAALLALSLSACALGTPARSSADPCSTTTYVQEFEGGPSSLPPEWASGAGDFGAPTGGFYGSLPGFGAGFIQNKTVPPIASVLRLTNLPPHHSVDVDFLVAIINSWDGIGGTGGGDAFNVSVNGTLVFSHVFALGTGTSDYSPPSGGLMGVSGWNEAFNMYLEPALHGIADTSSTLEIRWYASGGPNAPSWEGGDNESWAIDHVRIVLHSRHQPATLSLSSNPNPSTYGQPLVVTATVSPSLAAGTVAFFGGASLLASGAVVNGVATASISGLPVGSTTISARYGGNACFDSVTSPSLDQVVASGDDGTWTVWSSPSFMEHMAAYDPIDDKMIVFGNRYSTPGAGDTWSLSFTPSPTWQKLSTIHSPSPRSTGAMVYDSRRHRMLLFAGYDGTYENDVWQLNLSETLDWVQIIPSGTLPPGRHWCPAVYDSIADRVVVIGGYVGGPMLDDVWALNLSGSTPSWQQLAPSGTLPPTFGHVAVYEPVGRRIITWGSDGVLRQLSLEPTPAWSPLSVSGVGPPGRLYASAVFDPVDERMILFGGDGAPTNDVWGVSLGSSPTWRKLFLAGSAPAPTYALSAIYRDSDHSMVALGGIPTPTQFAVLNFARSEPVRYPRVQVLYPNGGEVLVVGSDYKFSWSASDSLGPVVVDLALSRDDASTYETIAQDSLNLGTLVWKVTAPGTNTSAIPTFAGRFRVTARNASGYTSSDESDAAFAIYELEPHHTVALTSVGRGTVVRSPDLPLYENGATLTLTALPDTGWSFVGWGGDTADAATPLQMAVYRNLSLTATFRDAVAPVTAVLYPNGGQILVTGSHYKFSWEASDQEGVIAVDVAISRDSGATWQPIATGEPNSGTYVWLGSRPGDNSGPVPVFASLLKISARDSAGNVGSDQSDAPFAIHDLNPLSVDSSPTTYAMVSVVPNPTSEASVITYALPEEATVRLSIFDLQGREVAVIAEGVKQAGTHRAIWEPSKDHGPRRAGVYFARYRTPRSVLFKRIVVAS